MGGIPKTGSRPGLDVTEARQPPRVEGIAPEGAGSRFEKNGEIGARGTSGEGAGGSPGSAKAPQPSSEEGRSVPRPTYQNGDLLRTAGLTAP